MANYDRQYVWICTVQYGITMGGGKGGGGTNTVTSAEPPAYVADAYKSAIAAAQGAASQPLQQYSGPMIAGFTPDQLQAFDTVANSQGMTKPYEQKAESALDASQRDIWGNAPQYSADEIAKYYNPYQQNVIDSTMANINETNAQQQQDLVGNIVQQGAWGGDRSAVMQAELARQQGLANNQTLAQIQQQGFQGAQQQFNTNQAANIGANEAQNWMASQAGQNYANLGTTAQTNAMTGASNLLQAGALQQQMGQQVLNVPYEQFQQQQAYPFQTAQYFANIAEGVGGQSPLTQTSSSTGPSPSTGSQIAGLGMAGLGMASALKSNPTGGLTGQNRGGAVGYADGGSVAPMLPRMAFGGYTGLPSVPNAGSSYVPQGGFRRGPSTMQRMSQPKSVTQVPDQPKSPTDMVSEGMTLYKGGKNLAEMFGGETAPTVDLTSLPSEVTSPTGAPASTIGPDGSLAGPSAEMPTASTIGPDGAITSAPTSGLNPAASTVTANGTPATMEAAQAAATAPESAGATLQAANAGTAPSLATASQTGVATGATDTAGVAAGAPTEGATLANAATPTTSAATDVAAKGVGEGVKDLAATAAKEGVKDVVTDVAADAATDVAAKSLADVATTSTTDAAINTITNAATNVAGEIAGELGAEAAAEAAAAASEVAGLSAAQFIPGFGQVLGAAAALASMFSNRGGAVHGMADGGEVDAVTPSTLTANPSSGGQIAQYRGLSPEQLQELSVRLGGDTQKGQMLRSVLEDKRMTPEQPEQSGFARGGIPRREDGGANYEQGPFSQAMGYIGDKFGEMGSDVMNRLTTPSRNYQAQHPNWQVDRLQAQRGDAEPLNVNPAYVPTQAPGVPDLDMSETQNMSYPMSQPVAGTGIPSASAPEPAPVAAPVAAPSNVIPAQDRFAARAAAPRAGLAAAPAQAPEEQEEPTTVQPAAQDAAKKLIAQGQSVYNEKPSLGMALMQAGFATMAGKSPYALTNIGEGAMSGMANYTQQAKDIGERAHRQSEIDNRAQQMLNQAQHYNRMDKRDEERTALEYDKLAQQKSYQSELLGIRKEASTGKMGADEHLAQRLTEQNPGMSLVEALSIIRHTDPAKLNLQYAKEARKVVSEGQINPDTKKPYTLSEANEMYGVKLPSAKTEASPAGKDVPKVGSVVKGFEFLGGNPSDKNNWKKAN